MTASLRRRLFDMRYHRYIPHQARRAANLIAFMLPVRYTQDRPGPARRR